MQNDLKQIESNFKDEKNLKENLQTQVQNL